MSNSDVLYEERRDSSVITIDRPEVHNAISAKTLADLRAAWTRAEIARTAAIVITGSGGAFSAGGDISEMQRATKESARDYLDAFRDFLDAIRGSKKPVIARVDGVCLGGGNEIALTADLTIASERSVFGLEGAAVGAAPVLAATQLLPRVVGEKRAREILFLCQRYSADEALAIGWINRVVPVAKLDETVDGWCARIATLSPQALAISKRSINASVAALAPAFDQGIAMLAEAFGSEELKEGMRAFMEKRKADFGKFR